MRVFERVRELTGRRDDGAEKRYQCGRCEARYALQHHVCPECGSYRVERFRSSDI